MRLITEALQNQFDSTFHMARVLVTVCTPEVWSKSYRGVPFWQQVFHYIKFSDFWLREKYDGSDWRSMIFDEAYTTDLDLDNYDGLFISQEDMLNYIDAIQEKTQRIFNNLDDSMLGNPVYGNDPHYSYTDVIVGQIRHIMYNIGYLNGILREQCLPESDWYSYNESEGA